MTDLPQVTAVAPAKAILLGEHAVNRGAGALAVSVGRYATCHVGRGAGAAGIRLRSGDHATTTTRSAILELGRSVDRYRTQRDYSAIQRLGAADYWAPHLYLMAALGDGLPESLAIRFSSTIPQGAGLGSGGAAFAALAAALGQLGGGAVDQRTLAAWAHRGDIVAHGGIASGLDTSTSLLGGAIRYTAAAGGASIPAAAGLTLVIGDTGVHAPTSAVNERVRRWLAARPTRLHYFGEIGLLARHAEAALCAGDWPELGRLMNLNHLILQRIGVSCAELDQLIDAALEAGALGAKLSGSGGGGIMLALAAPEHVAAVADAITRAGGTALVAPVGVPGVVVQRE